MKKLKTSKRLNLKAKLRSLKGGNTKNNNTYSKKLQELIKSAINNSKNKNDIEKQRILQNFINNSLVLIPTSNSNEDRQNKERFIKAVAKELGYKTTDTYTLTDKEKKKLNELYNVENTFMYTENNLSSGSHDSSNSSKSSKSSKSSNSSNSSNSFNSFKSKVQKPLTLLETNLKKARQNCLNIDESGINDFRRKLIIFLEIYEKLISANNKNNISVFNNQIKEMSSKDIWSIKDNLVLRSLKNIFLNNKCSYKNNDLKLYYSINFKESFLSRLENKNDFKKQDYIDLFVSDDGINNNNLNYFLDSLFFHVGLSNKKIENQKDIEIFIKELIDDFDKLLNTKTSKDIYNKVVKYNLILLNLFKTDDIIYKFQYFLLQDYLNKERKKPMNLPRVVKIAGIGNKTKNLAEQPIHEGYRGVENVVIRQSNN